MRQLFKVIKEHKASFDYYVTAEIGEEVTVAKEDDEMPKWYWCKNSREEEMWVPLTHIDLKGETAVFTQPYNTKEHDAKPGEVVQYLGESLGWIECLNSEWQYGWVPTPKLELINE